MCSDTLSHDLPWHSVDSLTPYDWWRKSVSIIYVIIQKKKNQFPLVRSWPWNRKHSSKQNSKPYHSTILIKLPPIDFFFLLYLSAMFNAVACTMALLIHSSTIYHLNFNQPPEQSPQPLILYSATKDFFLKREFPLITSLLKICHWLPIDSRKQSLKSLGYLHEGLYT